MIRLATKEDLPAVMEIVSCVKSEMKARGSSQWDEHYPTIATFETDLNHGELYVEEEDDQIRGICTISVTGHEEYDDIAFHSLHYLTLKRLAVDPKARKQGVALRLIQFAEAEANEKKCDALTTDTFSNNLAAQVFFQSLNFSFVEKRQNPSESTALIYYEKPLFN